MEGIDENTFYCVQTLEDPVWKPFFTDFFPEVLAGSVVFGILKGL